MAAPHKYDVLAYFLITQAAGREFLLKYRPEYPEKAFEGLDLARQWVNGFTDWYNHEHRHGSIKYVASFEAR